MKHSFIHINTILLLAALLSGLMPAKAYADIFGASDSLELIQLGQIVSQMTQIIEYTEQAIDFQETLEDLMSDSFFRRLEHNTANALSLFEIAGIRIPGVSSSDVLGRVRDIERIRRRAERISDYQFRETLNAFADSLRLVRDTSALIDDSVRIVKEVGNQGDFNSQDQILASIYHNDIEQRDMHDRLLLERHAQDMKSRSSLGAAYSVFSR